MRRVRIRGHLRKNVQMPRSSPRMKVRVRPHMRKMRHRR
jgi:hypothetical protein